MINHIIFQNEIILILSVLFYFSTLILFYRIFRKEGVFAWIVFETIAANIEVIILVKAFGMEMTLGNVLFASSFLATDIISEMYGKKDADKAVWLGVAVTVLFILTSIIWKMYVPSENDIAWKNINIVFSITPRVMTASIIAYIVSELFDVWCYHKIWNFTTEKFSNAEKFLWLRNNCATLISQLINTVVFTLCAFGGIYERKTIGSIMISSYIIFVFTSLLDTPFIYWARKIK